MVVEKNKIDLPSKYKHEELMDEQDEENEMLNI